MLLKRISGGTLEGNLGEIPKGLVGGFFFQKTFEETLETISGFWMNFGKGIYLLLGKFLKELLEELF